MMRRNLLTIFLSVALLMPAAACSDADTAGAGAAAIGAEAGEDLALPSEGSSVVDEGAVEAPGEGTTPTPEEPIVDEPVIDEPADDPIEELIPEETALTIAQVVPNKGLASGGEQVEIIGTKFGYGLQVFFGESASEDVFVLDETRLIAVTPPRLPGLVTVRVAYADGDGGWSETDELENGFLFYNPVTVIGIDPPSGHIFGGEPITITGTGFMSGSNVLIGGRSAIQVQIVDDNTILAVTPAASTAGTVDIHVSNAEGVGTLDDAYTYFENPAVEAVVPPVGLVTGGYQVEVRGAGFVEPLVVSFGAGMLEDVTVVGPDRLMGVVPEGAAGPVDVVISTAYGSAVGYDGFTYLDDMAPGATTELLAVTPGSGPAAGGTLVTLVAKGLTEEGETTVFFDGVAAEVKNIDPSGHTLIVEAPAGAVGLADVTLTNVNGSATLSDAFEYQSFIRVYEALPNFGPIEGGTDITVSGVGFENGLQLRIGALPASNVTVVDGETITATTPPGSAGLANVTVIQGDLSDVLVGGFSYQSEMDLWIVNPAQGSQAGGTVVELIGSGFPTDASVLVDGKPATHVTVNSPTSITARTPPSGYTGTVDVTVTSQTKGAVTLPWAFTYFDPESTFGGTWGNEVDGSVNVTVLSGGDGSPIPDAFVMLWTDPSTPYQGYTNQQGQITFSGVNLEGEQMVSASKEGYASTSVVEYDASNITLYMNPTSPPSSGNPPSIAPPIFKGQLVNAEKFVPVPWGQCNTKAAVGGTQCAPCTVDTDCTNGLICSDIPMQAIPGQRYCTQHCGTNDDCGEGYMCYPLNGVSEHQCVPSNGEVTAFCDFTKPTIFSRDYLPAPGQQVNEDFSFEMAIPFGEQAIFCWAGLYDPLLGTFTAYALGLARHVVGLIGDPPEVSHVIEQDIVLNHPLNGEMTVRLDDPPQNPSGPNFNYMFLHLDLGSDGTMEFLEHPFGFGNDPLVMNNVPKVLTADLYDASFTILAGAFSSTADNLPYSMTLHQGIKSIDDDTFFTWEEEGWTPRMTGVNKNIYDLWGVNENSMVAVGTDGLIIRSIGNSWANQDSGTDAHLNGVHALDDAHAIAVGEDGTALHYDGLVWTQQPVPTSYDLTSVWMAGTDEAFAVGWYNIQRWNGTNWTPMVGSQTSKNFQGIYGFAPDDVYAVGNYGAIVRYNGTEWVAIPSMTTQNLRSVWGATPDDVWIVGELGTIFRWNGFELSKIEVDTEETFEDVWGTGPDDVMFVGSKGTIYRWDGTQMLDESPPGFNATFFTVGGTTGGLVTTTGTHELLLGPMLQVPENISPADMGTMGEDYEISWTVKEGPDPHFSYLEIAVPGMTGPVPEWIVVNDYNVTNVLLPDFPSIEGTPGISDGSKILTLFRVYKEGFDIDNYSNQDFSQLKWRSWAIDQTTFTKL